MNTSFDVLTYQPIIAAEEHGQQKLYLSETLIENAAPEFSI
jgi:hypothetical protein